MRCIQTVLTGWFILVAPGVALAQTPEGLMKQDAATSGSTDVATTGFEAPAAKPDAETKDATNASISAGGVLSTGNSRSGAVTGSADTRVRRGQNQVSAQAAVNYARSGAPGESIETTVENYQGKVRYDRFLTDKFAVFMAVSARRDRFQGLDLRLNLDPGVAYYFIDQEKQQLWAEAGYDFQYDVRRDEALATALADGIDLDKTAAQHSARLFAGYDNKLNERVTFKTGLEYLQSVEEGERWRLNWDAGLTTSLTEKFSFATTFSLKYDNAPLPEVEELDTITAFNVVYTLL